MKHIQVLSPFAKSEILYDNGAWHLTERPKAVSTEVTKQRMNDLKTKQASTKKQQLEHWLIRLKTREHTRKRNKQLLDHVWRFLARVLGAPGTAQLVTFSF